MKRRLGVYSTEVPSLTHNHDDINATKKRLPRRRAFLATDIGIQNGEAYECDESSSCQTNRTHVRRRSSLGCVEPKIGKIMLRRSSSENNMIEVAENKHSKSAVKQKRVYIKSSPTDVIFGSSRKRHEGPVSIETYIRASWSSRYCEAETESEKSLIKCVALESIKERGGKLLKESSSKQGLYYEKNDLYAMWEIEKIFAQLNE